MKTIMNKLFGRKLAKMAYCIGHGNPPSIV